ncbi:hypothetical protein BH09BAC3_BH09BAC3_13390 [soil metagenome]
MDESFVIIDDDTSLYGLPPELKEHLIVTSPMIGLTPDQVDGIQGKALNLA